MHRSAHRRRGGCAQSVVTGSTRRQGCPYCQPPKVKVEVDVEVCKEVEELGKMTLLD